MAQPGRPGRRRLSHNYLHPLPWVPGPGHVVRLRSDAHRRAADLRGAVGPAPPDRRPRPAARCEQVWALVSSHMFAVTAARFDAENPLSGLDLGDRAEPVVPDGWTTVRVKAAALNHHDVWSLRGVGLSADRLPMILGCDAAGLDEDGREVVVHAVIGDAARRRAATRRWTRRRSLLSERHQGTFAELVTVPRRNLVPKPAALSFEQAACMPTAYLTAFRMLFDRAPVGPGATVLVQGAGGGVATALIQLGRAAGLRMWATSRERGQARAGAGARRGPGVRDRRPAAGAGGRGHGDGGRGHLGALAAVAEARRHRGDLRRDQRLGALGRPVPGLLPAAVGRRLHDGHQGRAGPAHSPSASRPESGR